MLSANLAIDLRSETTRPAVSGKFLVHGGNKLWIKGVTYGTFRPQGTEHQFPSPSVVDHDFCRMVAAGINALRTYTVPPRWLLDTARRYGLFVMVGLPWEQHIAFLDDRRRVQDIFRRVGATVRQAAGHPAILCWTIGNEIPPSIVRWHGAKAITQFLERLYVETKSADSSSLVTYVNYPSTEYLELPFLDLMTFNVYLETRPALERYLARLHNIAGDRPLLLAEVGLDSRRNGEGRQAEILEWQLRTAYQAGCVGTFVFSWTDEWYRGGHDIDDWDFGLTRRDRTAKPALAKVESLFLETPAIQQCRSPKVSVVVCSYNGGRTIRQCLEHLTRLDYPNYEVIVVNDGSTDSTREIATAYPVRLISTENQGLSSARNTGMKEAAGELIAYIDDDAWPDPHWLTYLVDTFEKSDHAGVGGPNIPPEDDTWIARCVANAPGGPIHVLVSDEIAEHIPGCNMAFRKSCLEEIGGFDTTFRVAGDDVDLCWRIQQRGWKIGFSPAAMVWHRRRGSVRAYWRQQKGYGKAEALLERKWPEKYQATGNVNWKGRLYGKGIIPLLGVKGRIYHGRWGTALFQSLYQPALDLWRCLPLMPEWYVIVGLLGGLAMLGTLWTPLFITATPLFLAAVGISIVQAVKGALRAYGVRVRRPRWSRSKELAVTTWLYLLQPCARLVGRWSTGLTPWRLHTRVPPAFPAAGLVMLWNEQWRDAEGILGMAEKAFQAHGAIVTHGGDFDCWDLDVRAGALGRVRVLLGIEEHGSGKQMLLFRHWPFWPATVVCVAFIAIALGLVAGSSGSLIIATILALGGIAVLIALAHQCGIAGRLVTTALHHLAETHPYIHRIEQRAQLQPNRSTDEAGLTNNRSPFPGSALPVTSQE